MRIHRLALTQFRCFERATFDFSGQIVLIEGPNGIGKTSLLEALHYACYLKSFRTHVGRELRRRGSDHFFLQVDFAEQCAGDQQSIQIGFSGEEKLVKLNNQAIQSYKNILSHYRMISSTEEDVMLIGGAPELRRTFLNRLVLLSEPQLLEEMRLYRQILSQRNMLLLRPGGVRADEHAIWTRQLWEQSGKIQVSCNAHLEQLQAAVARLAGEYVPHMQIAFSYKSKFMKQGESFDAFYERYQKTLMHTEQRFCRSLFGMHLDDFDIDLHGRSAKSFASRGQQKLIVLLAKIGQLQLLMGEGKPAALVLDDFLTDFDNSIINRLSTLLLSLPTQVFITCPLTAHIFSQNKTSLDVQTISL